MFDDLQNDDKKKKEAAPAPPTTVAPAGTGTPSTTDIVGKATGLSPYLNMFGIGEAKETKPEPGGSTTLGGLKEVWDSEGTPVVGKQSQNGFTDKDGKPALPK